MTAVKAGYRMLDCANDYDNEHVIGEALKELFAAGVVKREELFIQVVKLSICFFYHPIHRSWKGETVELKPSSRTCETRYNEDSWGPSGISLEQQSNVNVLVKNNYEDGLFSWTTSTLLSSTGHKLFPATVRNSTFEVAGVKNYAPDYQKKPAAPSLSLLICNFAAKLTLRPNGCFPAHKSKNSMFPLDDEVILMLMIMWWRYVLRWWWWQSSY